MSNHSNRELQRVNSVLGHAFNRYVNEYPDFAEKIPFNAHLIFHIEGYDEYNEWSDRIGKEGADPDQPIVYIIVKKFDPQKPTIMEQPEIKEAVRP